MAEQQKAFNPDQAAMDAVSSIQAIMALGKLGAQKSAQIQDIIADTIRAALSHAEGEAVGTLTIDNYGSDEFRALLPAMDLEPGTYEVYTHPAPQVAGLTETAIKSSPAYRALHREKEHLLGLLKDQAPQVAVPEAVKERVVEAIAEALGDAKDCIRVWTAWGVGTMGPDDFLDVAGDPDRLDEIAEAAITAMFTAAHTAPAGESDDSDICERVELPHVLAWADGVRGDMRTEYADRITDEEARVAQAVWAAHTGEQPVSDPDGLTEPGRREAEQAYINCAFDYARDPIGSRDWVLFWNGWRARNAAPAPDEREIAAKALERHADNLIVMAERDGRNSDRESHQTWEEAAYFAKQEADRLRAGQEGE